MDIKMHAIHKTPNTPDLGDGKNVNPVSVKFLPKKGNSKDSCCSIDEEKRQLRAQRPVWRENFTDFCRGGSLHGVRHLVDSYSRIRKIIWLVIILIIFLLFLYAIIQQIIFYASYPVSSTVTEKYFSELKFPAVTICNKNPCRMSAAYQKGWQGLLNVNTTFTGTLESVELLDYQKTCAQVLESMILKCTFNGKKCNLKYFKSVFTDRGQCYTLLSPNDDPYISTKPGPENGLKLLLNAETSEYSPSLSGQEGFHISLHDESEVAADAVGLSIAPGTSTSLAIDLNEVRSLPKPYGTCVESRKLRSPGPYTQSKCFQGCQRDRIRQRCFCDAIFTIPSSGDNFPICGMKIYQTCVKALKMNMTFAECNCPPGCHSKIYSSTVSFSRLSNQYIESFIKEKATNSKTNIERDFVENKLLQYHHANRETEQQRLDDVIKAYNSSVSMTYPYLTSEISNVALVLKNLSERSNGRRQFAELIARLRSEYDEKYHATVFSALESARLLVSKYLDAVTSFAFVTDQVNYTTGAMDENRVSQILRLKLDEFRIHYEHTIQSLDRVDRFYTNNKLKDYGRNQLQNRQRFRIGIISLYANISAISMHQSSNIDRFYGVADIFNQVILPMGASAYLWYSDQLTNLTSRVNELSGKLRESMKIVSIGPREWDNFVDKTLYRAGAPSYVYEAEQRWKSTKNTYLKDPGNITFREFIVARANGDLTNLTHFVEDLSEDLDRIEEATSNCLNIVEQLYTIIIESDILPASVLGEYPIWNISSQYLGLRIRWGSLAERNRPVFKSVFKDTVQRVREQLLSRKIPRHYYPNGIFDQLQNSVRRMDIDIKTTLTKLKDHMTYFLNSVSIENVFREELYKDNFCQVDIFYKELRVRTISQRAVLTASELLLYVGLVLAIYFGGSLFTLVEILDMLVRSVYTKYCHRDSNT